MLELALVFQPVDEAMEQFDREQVFPYENQPGRLILAGHSLTLTGVSGFVEEAISAICETLSCHHSQFSSKSLIQGEKKWVISRGRAEVLLQKYNWNIGKLQVEFVADKEKVLSSVRFEADSNLGELPSLLTTFSNTVSETELPHKVDTNEVDVVMKEPIAPSVAEIITEDSLTIDGVDLDFDLGDINVSNEPEQAILASPSSSSNPTVMESCTICGEVMLEGAPLSLYINNTVSNPAARQVCHIV
jgi:hypothetical protein